MRPHRPAPHLEHKEFQLDADFAIRHLDQLYRYARAVTGDRDQADDLVQDVVESLLRRPRRIQAQSHGRSYLFSMLRHRYLDGLRVKRRRPQVELERPGEEREARAGETPDARAEQREVLEAVRRLSLPYREALVAVDVAGLSYAEAATCLGVPVGTVMSRIHRARANVVAAVAVPV